MERDAVLDPVSGKMHLGCGHWADRFGEAFFVSR